MGRVGVPRLVAEASAAQRSEVLPLEGPLAFLSALGRGWDGTLEGAVAAVAGPAGGTQVLRFATTVLDSTGGDTAALAAGTVAEPEQQQAEPAAAGQAAESSQAALDELMASEPESDPEDEAARSPGPPGTDQAVPVGIANVWSSDEEDSD